MIRKPAKWLAVILSAAMITGSAPAYGADFSAESDISSELELEGQEDSRQEETEITEEPDSEEAEVDFSEDAENPEETVIEGEEEEDPDFTAVSSDDPENEGEEESKEYLKDLSVYSGYGVKDPLEIKRRNDLDDVFGGKTYTVDIGSSYNSGGFYVTADLGTDAPEGSVIKLSACDINGKNQETEIIATGYTDGKRYYLSDIFTKNNGNRAVYTVTAGTATDSQNYKIVVLRRLDLSWIGCYLPTDTDMAKNLITEFDSAGIIRDYEVAVGEDTKSVKISSKAFGDQWYGLTVNGKEVKDSTAQEISLDNEDTEITFQMQTEGTYQDPAYAGLTYTSTGTYKITVHKKSKTTVTFVTNPKDAVVSVYDDKGDRVESSKDADVYDSLYYGETYTYNVSKYGYISKRDTFTVGDENEITVNLEEQSAKYPEITDNDWINFRNSETNNGITDKATPVSKDTTAQKWALHLDKKGWDASLTPPLILGGYLYVASGQFIYKIDKNTGEIVQTSEQMQGDMQYAMMPLTYAEGMLFAQIGGGQIQAVSAKDLKSLWISEKMGGQTLSPITYKDGYIYTGMWTSDTTSGSYFCLSVTDEDPTTGTETKYCTWKYNHKGGFYWAGSYASSDYLVFGSDDGAGDAYTSILYSVNTHTGQLLDKLTDIKGDVRSTIVYNDGYVYFTTKGGYLYRVVMNADGTFGAVVSVELGGASSSSPVVYKHRIYLGVCGNGGQYNADGGHHFDVFTETSSGISLAYRVSVPGYPQTAPLLSTAYEGQDFNGDGQADGRVYLYFTYNAPPGGIYMLTDEPGQTSGEAQELFRPVSAQQEYCISTICVDRDGTLYYKNDSCYLMALETNGAYLDSITVDPDKGRATWEKAFQRSEKEHNIHVADNATKVTLTFKVPSGCSLTVNGQASNGTYVADVSAEKTDVKVTTTLGNKSRDYIIHLIKGQGNSSLANLIVSTSNTYSDTTKYLTISPAFNSTKTNYTVPYYADDEKNTEKKFLRVYVEPSDGNSTVTVQAVKGVQRVSAPSVVSGQTKRVNVYWEENADEAQVKILVTAKAGGKTEYYLTIQRKEIIPTAIPTVTPKPTEVPETFGPWKTISQATVFSPEVQMRTSNKGRQEKRNVGSKLTPTIRLTAKSIKLKVKQSTSKIKADNLANGDSIKSWESSNRKVVTVNNKGVIKAGKKTGKTKIIITLASGTKATINVTVQKTAVKTTKITGLNKKANLKKGQKLTLKPVLSPITSQDKISYTTSNKKVATVSKKGVVTAKKKGTAKITVKAGNKKYTITVKVK